MTATEALKAEVAYFQPRPEPTAEYARQFIAEVSKFAPEVIEGAHKRSMYLNSWMPSVATFISYCKEVSGQRESLEMLSQRRKEAQAAHSMAGSDREFGDLCLKVIRDALSGAITRRQYMDKLAELGLKDAESSLHVYYTQAGMDINKACGDKGWRKRRVSQL